MKTLVIYLLFIGLVSTGQAQEVIKMKPAVVKGTSFSMKLDPVTNSINFVISEKQDQIFHLNPLKFVLNNFDIKQLIKDNGSKHVLYHVIFKSTKGKLRVNYDGKGEIVSTYQGFKNVQLPHEVSKAIHNRGEGDIVRSKYVGTSRHGNIRKEFYKVKLQNGKKIKPLKINVDKRKSMLGLALR